MVGTKQIQMKKRGNMSAMTAAYLAAMAKSYSNQEGGIMIPADQLDQVVEIPLGFQPLGISSRPSPDGAGDDVLIAAYFEPAICRALVTRDENGLHFNVDWIRGVNHGIQSVRLFPDISQPGGANRAQCVFWGPDGNVWVSRNGERDFYVLSPPDKPDGRWTLTSKVILPSDDKGDQIHAGHMDSDGVIYTIESTQSPDKWRRRYYERRDDRWLQAELGICATLTYGLAKEPDGTVWTISDFRSNNLAKGLYYENRLVVPDICGNGIAFLSDGSALVARYGQSYPGCFNGIPGALVYVPAAMLKV
ncbi:MAG: hypothetical protein A2921_04480 [Candidatus Magasanikbacteria bacterium RIFCSPLOWO2_01_FULL_43_20b]|nr:MAG: hypothetical protein A3C74_02675 [Candidatus Magasanikbacteria bacterium RIFCSPHIGHO2_02_FULL_44_13]OGH73325.1 MAG: hypothetical protein A2921_04480 [Candidatus Magasanikbacteria bacterium RIFCSPLOWO2_01_FULL_43_20b]